MNADLPATPVLAQFEMGKNDPILQALKPFILQNLCQLGRVTLLTTYPRGKETRSFHVEFFDEGHVRHRIEGILCRHDVPEHQPHDPSKPLEAYNWSVGEDWSYIW
jgi:hypothetical protein